jgi:uncharacterized protein (DUF362 family)
MVVGIVRANIKSAKYKVAELIKLVGYRPRRHRLFLKPNIVTPMKPHRGGITHPAVVEGIIRAFPDYEIVIGEGNAYGTTKHTFEAVGYGRLKREYNIDLIDLDDTERFTVHWKFGELALPKILKTHEYINVPTMKTHSQTGVTLTVKNQKGLLTVETKRNFHRRWGLNDALLELSKVIQPDFTVMDAIYCIEKDGPGDFFGRRKVMNLLLAGTDFIEVDNVCVAIMGHDINEIKHIPAKRFELVGEPLEAVRSNFVKARPVWDVLNLHIHLGLACCSGCTESVDEAFTEIKMSLIKFIKCFFSLLSRKDILVGKDARIPKKYGRLICFGACTKKLATQHKLEHIPGCPPNKEDIIRIFA